VPGRGSTVLRMLGALALLVVGAVHLERYFAVHFRVVPVIGPLFLLNFFGATAIGLLLLLPLDRNHSPARSADCSHSAEPASPRRPLCSCS
jgi:hypothetical protein